MAAARLVKLDVGGTVFKTARSTLTKFDGFFKALLESEMYDADEAGCIFVDRSPKHFELILNFLRDGRTPIPESEFDREQLLQEAQYYMLDGLIYLCGGEPSEAWVKANITTDSVRHNSDVDVQITTDLDDCYQFEQDYNDAHAITVHYDIRKWGDISENPSVIDFAQRHGERWKILFYNRYTQMDFIHVNVPGRDRWRFVCLETTSSSFIFDIDRTLREVEQHMIF